MVTNYLGGGGGGVMVIQAWGEKFLSASGKKGMKSNKKIEKKKKKGKRIF